MFAASTVLLVIAWYMVGLFLVALWAERRAPHDGHGFRGPVVYSLSLAVYCSAWTYYGSVGTAATSGPLFLTTYLGPTVGAILWWTVLRKLVRIKDAYRITSIADLISARYNRSHRLGALVTAMAFVGIVPYMALQFKAVDQSLAIITAAPDQVASWISRHAGLLVLAMVLVFTLVMGTRRLDPTERHPGMMMALAVECIVKLVAFIAAGVFVTYWMHGGFGDLIARIPDAWQADVFREQARGRSISELWAAYTILSMSAVMFLPRQFHVAVVENRDESHIRTAMWLFPLYLLLINVFVFPIAAAGLSAGYPPSLADTFVLQLPISQGQKWLSMLVFVGGFSAATGMIMVCSMTMATMLTNHIVLPVIGWIPGLAFLRRHLLGSRWVMVTVFVGLGYWSARYLAGTYMLDNMGLISFAAVLQFATPILGGLFWRRGTEKGAILGLLVGFAVWAYTLLLPAFVRSGWLPPVILDGPFGMGFLSPEHLFGIESMHHMTHAVFLSLTLNVSLYVVGSLVSAPDAEAQRVADEFVGILSERGRRGTLHGTEATVEFARKRRMVEDLFHQYFGYPRATLLTGQCIEEAGLDGRTRISVMELAELRGKVERTLAGSIGAPEAHRAIEDHFVFTPEEEGELSEAYGEILTQLKLTPEQLEDKVDYYRARERLLSRHAAELEALVKERTKDLHSAQEELIKREKLAVLGQLTAFVSHELRNPLGVIRSSVYILSRRGRNNDPRTERHLKKIERQVTRCDSIVEELLAYTRGRRHAPMTADFNPWLKGVLEQLVPPNGIFLTSDLATDLPPVRFDKEKMRSAITNLVSNSVHALNARIEDNNGGNRTFVPTVEVLTSRQGGYVRLEVRDNGVGMSREIVQRAFEPLFTTRARGTGLGLPIVAQIAEEHGGSIKLASTPNRGTSVIFEIPIESEHHDH
ncbi:MAG: ATP-binding protein [Thermodesulfobacteriota bacterium]